MRIFAPAVALVMLLLAACASPPVSNDPNAPPPNPCDQAGQVIQASSLAIASAQTGYAVLVAAGAVKPKPATDALINAAFDAANQAALKASQDRLAGKCDVTTYISDINAALSKAAQGIAQARAEQAAADAKAKEERRARNHPDKPAEKPAS